MSKKVQYANPAHEINIISLQSLQTRRQGDVHTLRARTAKVALLDIIAEKRLETAGILRSQNHLVPAIMFRHPFAEPLLGLAVLIVDCCVDEVPYSVGSICNVRSAGGGIR